MFFKKKYPREFPITQPAGTTPTKAQKEQIDRMFGMFVHFGINTFNNTEWSDGTLLVQSYCPSAVDVDEWVETAYKAGMKYVIIITKHHDGFCMWDTNTTDYCVNNSPNKTDIVAEACKACKKYGVKLALYYSLWDRHEKCYKDSEKYTEYMEKHLTELLGGRYGEVVELWLDGEWDKPCRKWQLDRIYNLVKSLQPDCQVGVNLTIGKYTYFKKKPKDRYLPKNQREGDPMRMFPSDFRLWDPHMCSENDPKIFTFNGKNYYLPFEQTICSRKEGKWFYSDEYDKCTLLDIEETAKNYEILKKNNNLMVINMPPKKDGRLVEADKENLFKLAKRLGIYIETD